MANYTKLKVIWKNNLNNIYKENTIIGVGQEAIINLDEKGITSIYVTFKVNGQIYTDIVEIDGNVISVPFKSNVLKVGTHQLEIVAHLKNGDVIPSPIFTYYVEESLSTLGEDIPADNNYPILIELLERINNITVNEELRIENENDRLEYEVARENSETQRISEENERLEKEVERLNNEIERINNEDNRVANENNRIANEERRKSDEILRVNNEDIRQRFYNDYNNKIRQLENELDNLISYIEDRLNRINSQLEYIMEIINNL